jgi:NitT/TauT family transport system ATP-binding protein
MVHGLAATAGGSNLIERTPARCWEWWRWVHTFMLSAVRVTHHFYSDKGSLLALQNVTLRIAEGEFVALVGPSGSGKTTLLRMVAGLETPEQGTIYYKNAPLTSPPEEIGVVFQKGALLPWRTVRENIALPYEVAGQPVARERVETLMQRVGLMGFEQAHPHELSGGMQQRVAVARALIRAPKVLLMDEPFAALDMFLRQEMNDLVLGLWAEHKPTVLFVTHELAEAVYLADRVVVLSPRPGQVVGEVRVGLPRPRRAEMRYGAAVTPYVEQIWRMMNESERKQQQ